MKPWRRWQDWVPLVLAVWLVVATFVFASGRTEAMAAVTALAVILGAAALVAMTRPEMVVARWVMVVAAVLLIVAPWALGYADLAGLAWSSWIGGVIAVIMEGMALPQLRRGGRPQPHS